MNEKLRNLLTLTKDVHLPMPIDEKEMAETRLLHKPLFDNRLIDDMESLAHWKTVTDYAQMSLSNEHFIQGSHSLKFTHPTNLPGWNETNVGRIYACPSVYRVIDREDWREWNRLSAWIYPVAPGMNSITLRIQLHNDGAVKVPDQYEREGAHNMSLKGNCWNHIVLEIPYLARDCVTGVSFDYDMVGHEPQADDHVTWFIDQLELQKVKADVYEGWIPADDRICFSGSGYQTGSTKLAILSESVISNTFKLIETETGRVVLEKAIETIQSRFGTLRYLDFTEVMEEGSYLLIVGELTSRVFQIANDLWEPSVWKMLNFFLTQRCGYEVAGKHRACHSDMLLKHNGKAIVANGGWHDAGDLAQGLNNTNEATAALLDLAHSLEGKNDRLYQRVLEEAKWGLDYVIKMRFGDGYRASYSSCSVWTDGVIGTADDISSFPTKSAYTNFDAAYAEALGAQVFADEDPDYATYALKIAKEDFAFGVQILYDVQNGVPADTDEPQFNIGDFMDVQIGAMGALAAAELFKADGEESYSQKAQEYGQLLMDCQQKEWTDWDVPMVGFFYQDRQKDLIWHHNHMSYSYLPDLALRTLCETFGDSPLYMQWYAALARSGMYYQQMADYTFPYGIIPAGVYHVDEATDLGMKAMCSHPMMGEAEIPFYKQQVEKGFPLGKGYFLRVYPVWFSFRGDYNVLLSESKAMSSGALLRNNYALYTASQQQYEWIVGKNPTCQSTLYGEGYDYIQLYTVQPGQNVGQISVGMESHFDEDAPYWPQVNNATYKEVWICPATKWMWCMADNLLPATVSGYLTGTGDVRFVHQQTKQAWTACPHTRTGWFEIALPAGIYTMTYGKISRTLTVISGRDYVFDGTFYGIEATAIQEDVTVSVTIRVQSEKPLSIAFQTDNLELDFNHVELPANGQVTFVGTIQNPKQPWIGVVIPNDNRADMTELIGNRADAN